jgi:hypothetical protein
VAFNLYEKDLPVAFVLNTVQYIFAQQAVLSFTSGGGIKILGGGLFFFYFAADCRHILHIIFVGGFFLSFTWSHIHPPF